jgi:multidrug efflux pump
LATFVGLCAIGTGVIGGILASTVVASFFVPLFFVLLENATGLFARSKTKTLQPKTHDGGSSHA